MTDLLEIPTDLPVTEWSLKPRISDEERAQLVALTRQMDFGWLDKLSAFEHWSFEHHSPWDRLETRLSDYDLFGFPEPDLRILERWAYLAVIAALAGDIPPPNRALRKLAQLLNTTESFAAMSLANEVLAWERRMYTALEEKGRLPATAWEPLTMDGLRRIGRLLITMETLLRPERKRTGFGIFKDAPAFQCLALGAPTMAPLAAFRPIMIQGDPEAYKTIDAALTMAEHCQARALRATWNNETYLHNRMDDYDMFGTVSFPDGAESAGDNPVSVFQLAESPATAKMAAFALLSTGTGDFYRPYEDPCSVPGGCPPEDEVDAE